MTVAERLTAESKERGITARRLASMLLDYALDRLAAGELQPIEKVEPVKEVAK